VKDLQASQKRTTDQLETALQLLTSEQQKSKTMADALAALSARVDTLQRSTVPVAKKPAPRKQPAAARPPVARPEPSEPEPPGAATPLRPSADLTGDR
jgi:hypothetical protein